MKAQTPVRVITVQRGNNIGNAIIKDFENDGLWQNIAVKTINVVRKPLKRVNEVTIGYIHNYKKKPR